MRYFLFNELSLIQPLLVCSDSQLIQSLLFNSHSKNVVWYFNQKRVLLFLGELRNQQSNRVIEIKTLCVHLTILGAPHSVLHVLRIELYQVSLFILFLNYTPEADVLVKELGRKDKHASLRVSDNCDVARKSNLHIRDRLARKCLRNLGLEISHLTLNSSRHIFQLVKVFLLVVRLELAAAAFQSRNETPDRRILLYVNIFQRRFLSLLGRNLVNLFF